MADDSAATADAGSWPAGHKANFQLRKDKLSKGLVSHAGNRGYKPRVASRIRKNNLLPTILLGKHGKKVARLKATSLNHVVRLGVPVSFGRVMQGALVIDRVG